MPDASAEVFFHGNIGAPEWSDMGRLPVGRPGTTGIYLLSRCGDHLFPVIRRDASFVTIAPEQYVNETSTSIISEHIATSLLEGALSSETDLIDISFERAIWGATRLTSLSFVETWLRAKLDNGAQKNKITACEYLTAHFLRTGSCSKVLRAAGDVTSVESDRLLRAEEHGLERIRQMRVDLTRNVPVMIFSGMFNSVPGGVCEVLTHYESHHDLSLRQAVMSAQVKHCGSIPSRK